MPGNPALEITSAISAPVDAGTASDQESTPTGNSAGESESSTRQSGAETQSDPKKKQPPKQQAKPKDDEPEWEFSDGKKRKRGDVEKRLSEVAAGAQKAHARAVEAEKRIEAFNARLAKLGLDPEAFDDDDKADAAFSKAAQERLAKQLEEATRDPRELAAERSKAEAEEYKRKLAEFEENQRKAEHQKEVDRVHDVIAGNFATALKEQGLPVNPKSVWLMASLLQGARRKGEQISWGELARRTEEQIDGDIDHYLPAEDGAALAKRLGPKRTEALRKHLLTEHQSKFNQPNTPARGSEPKVLVSKNHPAGYHTLDEMLEAERKAKRR